MMEVIVVLLIILLIPTTALGTMFLFYLIKPKDGFTNRISHLRLVWLALAYPGEFRTYFPWLTKDVHENLKD